MTKVKSLDDLKKMREQLQSQVSLRVNSETPEKMVQVKVSMATCGIASGAKEIMNLFVNELDRRAIDAVITQTGCMGYCFAEPTIEVTIPGKEPVVFGYVNAQKANEIIEQYVVAGNLVDGIIPANYETVKEQKNK